MISGLISLLTSQIMFSQIVNLINLLYILTLVNEHFNIISQI